MCALAILRPNGRTTTSIENKRLYVYIFPVGPLSLFCGMTDGNLGNISDNLGNRPLQVDSLGSTRERAFSFAKK